MTPDDLSEPERRLWDASGRGDHVDLRSGEGETDDPAQAGRWGEGRTIRAEVIRALLLGGGERQAGYVPAIRATGARVTGRLAIPHAEVTLPIFMAGCSFTDTPDLTWSRTRAMEFSHCRLPGITARFTHFDANLILRSCSIIGQTDLFGAHIAGQLDLQGTRLSHPGSIALAGDGLAVESSVSCRHGFSAEGEIRLEGARVGASLEMQGAALSNPGGTVLSADRLTVGASLLCCDGFTTRGEIRLRSAHIAGDIELSDASLSNGDGLVLDAEHLSVEGSVFARRIATEGEVRLFAARVGGPLVFDAAHLTNPGGLVVLADDGLSVGGSALFGEVVAFGEICMLRTTIGGLLSFMGAQLTNVDATVLRLHGLTAGAGVHLGNGFTAVGQVALGQARIDGWLNLNDARLSNPEGLALVCTGTAMRLLRLHTREQVTGTIDLSYARIEQLDDDLGSWPAQLRLDGLTYDNLVKPGTADKRLEWISRDNSNGYLPQPYEQLAAAYRRLGDDPSARTVLLAKQRRRRETLRWYSKLWGYLQDVTVGYGYRPMRAAAWLLALLTTGTVAYSLHHPPPIEPGKAPAFNPLVYSLDLLLPVVNFGQEKAFNPTGAWQWLAYALIASGWILATTITAGITRTISRQ